MQVVAPDLSKSDQSMRHNMKSRYLPANTTTLLVLSCLRLSTVQKAEKKERGHKKFCGHFGTTNVSGVLTSKRTSRSRMRIYSAATAALEEMTTDIGTTPG